MSEKPSLYVVERKEVVILVVLFVLVTVLSFTVGVRYGEKIGRKLSMEESSVQKEHDGELTEKNGGTLGLNGKTEAALPKEAVTAEKVGGSLSVSGEKETAAKEGKKEEKPGMEPKPEMKHEAESHAAPLPAATVNAVDASSDEALLSALKGAGVEPQSGKASAEAKSLPEDVKSIRAGAFVIQVGSHPTKKEAEEQVHLLQMRQVNTQILAPFKDSQGEWFRVVIGPYKTKSEAEKEAKNLKAKGFIFSFFVRKM